MELLSVVAIDRQAVSYEYVGGCPAFCIVIRNVPRVLRVVQVSLPNCEQSFRGDLGLNVSAVFASSLDSRVNDLCQEIVKKTLVQQRIAYSQPIQETGQSPTSQDNFVFNRSAFLKAPMWNTKSRWGLARNYTRTTRSDQIRVRVDV